MGRVAGAATGKLWRDAIRLAANRETKTPDGKKVKNLNLIADRLVQLAIEGDVAAIKEIGDRLDGKAVQSIAGDPDNPLAAVLTIKHAPIKPNDA